MDRGDYLDELAALTARASKDLNAASVLSALMVHIHAVMLGEFSGQIEYSDEDGGSSHRIDRDLE